MGFNSGFKGLIHYPETLKQVTVNSISYSTF